MNDLTLRREPETHQVIIEGLAAGAAGEAPLIPVPGLDLAFDRFDGHLCRAIVDPAETGEAVAVGEQAAEALTRLFGRGSPTVVSRVMTSTGEAWPRACLRSAEPGLAGALSSLARLDAGKITSPIPPSSPWWAAEAAEFAQRAGLEPRAHAEGRQALDGVLEQVERLDPSVLPEQAVRAASAVAAINVPTEPTAARRLWAAIEPAVGARSVPRLPISPSAPLLDVAAEVERLQNGRVRQVSLEWTLDPGLVSQGLIQLGLSPYSDLVVRYDVAADGVTVEAQLAPGADHDALDRYRARLVDPAAGRILAQGGFTRVKSRVRAELEPSFSLDELPEIWIDVVPDKHRPIRSARGRRISRAVRWADAALRAERAPLGLAPAAACQAWAALAAAAWKHCQRDWAAAGHADRAYLAALRQAACDPNRTCVPHVPSAIAAEIGRRVPIDGPTYLAEVLGR